MWLMFIVCVLAGGRGSGGLQLVSADQCYL